MSSRFRKVGSRPALAVLPILVGLLSCFTACDRPTAPSPDASAMSTRSQVPSHHWGVWGVDGNSDFQALAAAGIREISVAGYVTGPFHDQPAAAAAAANQVIAAANSAGIPRATAYIILPQISRADTIGSLQEIETYIDACNTTFFNIDEPYLHEMTDDGTAPAWVIQGIIDYVNHLNTVAEGDNWAQGVYVSSAEPAFHEEYFGGVYRMMPDFYAQPLEWKRRQYYRVGSLTPIAPLIALIQRVGGGCGVAPLPDYFDLKAEHNNAAPYCSTIWFYGGVTSCGSYNMFTDGGIELVTDLIAAMNPGAHPWDLNAWVPPFGTGAPEVPIGQAYPATADYDGDGRDDISMKWWDGHWYVNYSSTGFGTGWEAPYSFSAGDQNVVPTVADYDADGVPDRAAYDGTASGGGRWLISYSTWGNDPGWDHTTYTAQEGARAFPGDHDGDGRGDIALGCSDGKWRIDYSSNGFENEFFVTGVWDYVDDTVTIQPGWEPAAGDFDGDGILDRVQWLASTAIWRIVFGMTSWSRTLDYAGPVGAAGRPMPADYDGDGVDDVSVVTDTAWYVDFSSDGFGDWDDVWDNETFDGALCTADFDGDGRADRSMLNSDGTWEINMWEASFGTKLSHNIVQEP